MAPENSVDEVKQGGALPLCIGGLTAVTFCLTTKNIHSDILVMKIPSIRLLLVTCSWFNKYCYLDNGRLEIFCQAVNFTDK